MDLLTDADRERVRAAIAAAESRTAGEFVTVVAQRAAHYLEFALLYAMIAGTLVAVSEPLWGGWGRPSALVGGALVELLVALALVLFPALRLRLVPRAVRVARCRALARQQFVLRGVGRTRGRTGVLLFVAADERYVEIIADQGIHAAVPAGFWDGVVLQFTTHVTKGEVAEGFEIAVAAIGAALAQHAPPAADDMNELPDRLLEI